MGLRSDFRGTESATPVFASACGLHRLRCAVIPLLMTLRIKI